MTEVKDTDGKKTLRLRTGDSGTVRQSRVRGGSKQVVVEKKRKRIAAPPSRDAGKAAEPAASAPAPAPRAPSPASAVDAPVSASASETARKIAAVKAAAAREAAAKAAAAKLAEQARAEQAAAQQAAQKVAQQAETAPTEAAAVNTAEKTAEAKTAEAPSAEASTPAQSAQSAAPPSRAETTDAAPAANAAPSTPTKTDAAATATAPSTPPPAAKPAAAQAEGAAPRPADAPTSTPASSPSTPPPAQTAQAAPPRAARERPTPPAEPTARAGERASAGEKPTAERGARGGGGRAAQRGGRQRGGVVLRTLTEQEKQARAKALVFARSREEVERRAAEEEARRRAEEEAQRERERLEAERRRQEEEARRKSEEAARRKSEEEAARRLAAEEAERAERKRNEAADSSAALAATSRARAAAPGERDEDDSGRRGRRGGRSAGGAGRGAATPTPTPSRGRGDGKRRGGKLTVTTALQDDERQRSIAAFRRAQERRHRAQSGGAARERQKIERDVIIPETITVQELSNRMAERAGDVVKALMKMGMMVTVNQTVDADTAQLVVEEFGHRFQRVAESDVEEGLISAEDSEDALSPRPPVVTIMGHVDHGKTSLLDALRSTDVVSGEAGGITQHIGAYQVRVESGERVTFIDTPGHAAFTAMRARGAKSTDIVVLVVAADDGVMPQTIEAIAHARAAEAPLVIAVNKMDKPEANPDRVRNDLLRHEVVVEELGGDVQAVPVSAKKREGLDKLVEAILLQAEVMELKANPNRSAEGVVIEAQLDRGRGPVATVLVQRGTLRQGDIFVAGAQWGRVRALVNERGEQIDEAGPSTPAEVLGLQGTPEAGDHFVVVESEARAREIADYRQRKLRDQRVARGVTAPTSLEQMMSQIKASDLQELPVVVKGDVQGSVEAIVAALEGAGNEEVAVRVLHFGVGGVTESDVQLAGASKAPILAFNVRANKQARDMAQQDGVEIRYYSVIYDLVDEIRAALTGMLAPERKETFIGYATIKEVFHISKIGKVAGCQVTEGVARRSAGVRLLRDDVVIHEGTLKTLKRFKDEVREVHAGQECGMAFERYEDIRVGDVIEIFEVEEIARKL